jgi:hypothetical protein
VAERVAMLMLQKLRSGTKEARWSWRQAASGNSYEVGKYQGMLTGIYIYYYYTIIYIMILHSIIYIYIIYNLQYIYILCHIGM